ncbi:MAG: hypothetical protein RL272_17 [Candidatus Parcubacteria bacterium]|jgi:hypothetical protein
MKRRAALPIFIASFVAGTMFSPLLLGMRAANAEDGSQPCAAGPAPAAPPVGTPVQGPENPSTTDPVIGATATIPETIARARFSEVFPDPAGADDLNEFIEIENASDTDADLAGWQVENAAGKSFTIGVRVGPHAAYAFTYAETKIALVNTGMTLTLRDPSGAVVDTLTYGGPARTGRTYARLSDGSWQWTAVPTPGSENAFDVPTQTPAALPDRSPGVADPTQDAPEPTDPPVAPPPSVPASPRVSIVEFIPDPVGDDAAEWVALRNDGEDDALLDGWKLDDAAGGSEPFSLSGMRIAAGSRAVIERAASKIALNNAGDEVRLIGPDGVPTQTVAYANAPEGKTYALTGGAWKWLPEDVPGPGAGKISAAGVVTAVEPGQSPDAANEPPDTAEVPTEASVADISADDDSLMAIEGVVTLAPGIVGKRTFAIQDPSGLGGVFVRAYGSSPMPQLAAGDAVRIVGRSSVGTGAGFSTTGAGIMKNGAGTVTPEEKRVADIGDDETGMMVAITGIVARRGKTVMTLADEAAREAIIVHAVARTSFPLAAITGSTVTARGVVRSRSGRTELFLSGKDAVTVAAPPRAIPSPDPPTRGGGEVPSPTPEQRKPLVFAYAAEKAASGIAIGSAVAALSAAIAVLAIIAKRRRTEEPDRLAADR